MLLSVVTVHLYFVKTFMAFIITVIDLYSAFTTRPFKLHE